MKSCPAGDIDSTTGGCKVRYVESWFRVSETGSRSACVQWCGGSMLASGHTIIEVIDTYNGHIYIPASGVNEVIPPDGNEVAISTEDYYLQFRVCQLQPGGEGYSSAVSSVE